jgi:hypothetical protein
VTTTAPVAEIRLVTTFRRVLLGLAAAGIVGTGVELAMLRHWNSRDQLIPWFALAVLALALVLIVLAGARGAVMIARVAAAAVALAALYGVVTHVRANYHAAPLDFRYTDSWAGMSTASRWWTAATGGVGPSPTLAPLILAQSAACLWLATLRHPSQPSRRPGAGQDRRSRLPPSGLAPNKGSFSH